jgi:hypothetical protein
MTYDRRTLHPQLLPRICLLCGVPYPAADWRFTRSEYGVIYLCDDCCRRVGPRRAYLMARHFLVVLAHLARSLQAAGRPARPFAGDRQAR